MRSLVSKGRERIDSKRDEKKQKIEGLRCERGMFGRVEVADTYHNCFSPAESLCLRLPHPLILRQRCHAEMRIVEEK
jgi:hypothetical protein